MWFLPYLWAFVLSSLKVRGWKTTSSDMPTRWAKKKFKISFSNGRILAYKTAHFPTFRPVNDHFGSLSDHRMKSSFLVPDQSSGVQNDQLGWAEKMGKTKIRNFFFKGPNFSAQNGPFFNFSHCKWSFLIDRRSSLEILVFSPRSKFGGAKRLARTGREDGRKKNWRFFFQRPAF